MKPWQANGLQKTDIDWLVPHQANIRIIQATAKKLGMGMERVVVTVDRHGNTSAASIPLAFDTAVREGKYQTGRTGADGSLWRRLHLGVGAR
jgi:3-oxoacyl-[acyl-carrier-protein] synthase-3